MITALVFFVPLSTYSMESANYIIDQDSINFGGTEDSSSASYRLSDTMGEVATGESGGACYALSFDGNDYVGFAADDGPVSGTGNFSLGAWIKTSSSSLQYIMQQRDSSDVQGEYVLQVSSTGRLNYWDYNSGYGFNISSDTSVNDGSWHHVAFTRNGTTGTLYIDGAAAKIATSTVKDILAVRDFAIGIDRRDSVSYFSGSIDDARVYNRALSETEIADLYKGSQADSTGLVGHWNLNEGSGTTANDLSGNSNTGTISGAVFSTDTPAATCKILGAGYRQMDQVYLAMSSPDGVDMLPAIGGMTGGTGYGSTFWNVKTDNPAGYQVNVRATTSPALKIEDYSFADYTPAGGNILDYAWSVASTDSEFGYTIEGDDAVSRFLDNGSACGAGSGNTADSCWAPFSVSDQSVINAGSPNHPLGTDTTIKFRAQSGGEHIQPNGTYTATIVVTAVAL